MFCTCCQIEGHQIVVLKIWQSQSFTKKNNEGASQQKQYATFDINSGRKINKAMQIAHVAHTNKGHALYNVFVADRLKFLFPDLTFFNEIYIQVESSWLILTSRLDCTKFYNPFSD